MSMEMAVPDSFYCLPLNSSETFNHIFIIWHNCSLAGLLLDTTDYQLL